MSNTPERVAKDLAQAEHDATGEVAEARSTPVVAALGKLSDVADQPPLFWLSLGAVALGALTRRPKLVRTGARMFVAEALATALKTAVKTGVDRTRPARANESGAEIGSGRGGEDSDHNSFPSGHTAGAVAVAQAIAHERVGAALPVRLAAAGIGVVQLPRGKHYLSDVAAGAAIGWAAERIAGALIEAAEHSWTHRRRPAADPLAEAEAHPS